MLDVRTLTYISFQSYYRCTFLVVVSLYAQADILTVPPVIIIIISNELD